MGAITATAIAGMARSYRRFAQSHRSIMKQIGNPPCRSAPWAR